MEGINPLLLPSTDPSWKFDSVQEMRTTARVRDRWWLEGIVPVRDPQGRTMGDSACDARFFSSCWSVRWNYKIESRSFDELLEVPVACEEGDSAINTALGDECVAQARLAPLCHCGAWPGYDSRLAGCEIAKRTHLYPLETWRYVFMERLFMALDLSPRIVPIGF
jgi:hypothetical protein